MSEVRWRYEEAWGAAERTCRAAWADLLGASGGYKASGLPPVAF
jgi:hypothetical protein